MSLSPSQLFSSTSLILSIANYAVLTANGSTCWFFLCIELENLFFDKKFLFFLISILLDFFLDFFDFPENLEASSSSSFSSYSSPFSPSSSSWCKYFSLNFSSSSAADAQESRGSSSISSSSSSFIYNKLQF